MSPACLILLLVSLSAAIADGNVGCQFNKAVCEEDLEWCYNDYAFGRCVPNDIERQELKQYRQNLGTDDLQAIEHELQRLDVLGYRWTHRYTQCVVQLMLISIQEGTDFDKNDCTGVADQDLTAVLKALVGSESGKLDSDQLAQVKFTPSIHDPRSDYADEVYVPIRERLMEDRLRNYPESVVKLEESPEINKIYGSSLKQLLFDKPKRSRHRVPYEQVELKEPGVFPISEFLDPPSRHFSEKYNTPENFRLGLESRDGEWKEPLAEILADELKTFNRNYNTPDSFRQGFESKDYKDPEPETFAEERFRNEYESREQPATFIDRLSKNVFASPEERELLLDTFRDGPEDRLSHDLQILANEEEEQEINQPINVYAEGGTQFLQDGDRAETTVPGLEDLVKDYANLGWGFKRPERLDVKKPGPNFSTNNYSFKDDKNNGKVGHIPKPLAQIASQTYKEALDDHHLQNRPALLQKNEKDIAEMKAEGSSMENPYLRKLPGNNDQSINVRFKERPTSWPEGAVKVRNLAKFLGLDSNIFSHIIITDENDVNFKIDPSRTELSAAEIVNKLDATKDKLKEEPEMEIESVWVNKNEGRKDVVKKKAGSPMENPNLRKSPSATEEVYVRFKERPTIWPDAALKIRNLAQILGLDKNLFSHIVVNDDDNVITFKVEPSRSELSATEIVKKADAMKEKLKESPGMEIESIWVQKDKSQQPSIEPIIGEERQLWLLSFLLCGVIAAAAIGGAALFVIRRHARTRDKLSGLTQPDSEASKDYQDLCRARMASKSGQDKPESAITRISKENENQSPSSRSSTSSWSEEPALTNMDISTGHMVLSYMEDHLKNKDRLEQEWVALCAYEAEPCATTIAVKPDNIKKNRYPNIVPYDHARVVLNELLNATGSDYINASSITDHDPRNPAYIATQGPLPNTAADLWQMVWEQGSVVMVMLTRLTENGTAICHRYWPEEGSEVYHIYEVHLVSEHIWCDDYLVRSFYLKNLKTAETRTVTQFHFLSWPENGVPLSTKALLEFRRKVNKSYRGRSCPIVVHCSDGIGRSGTYCLIDMVLNRMAKGAKEIDIAATLEHIRDQRPLMVKTKQQFEFVLMAVAEEVHAILKALPATHSPPPVTKEKE